MSEELDNILTEDSSVASAGAPTPVNTGDGGAPTPAPTVPAEQAPQPVENKPQILKAAPTVMRDESEKVAVDDNYNLTYVLKNGKSLKLSVKKPDLEASTKLSDNQVRIEEDATGNRSLMVNNVGVYREIMAEFIRVILVDGAPLHTVNFDSLSQIGMTKSELDDLMSIIVTFYLSE